MSSPTIRNFPAVTDVPSFPSATLRFTQFSYGQVELINQEDLDTLIVSLRSKDSASSTNTEKGGAK